LALQPAKDAAMSSSHPFLDHPRPIAFAHRGGGLENDENTMSAFAHAYDLGYRHLETDVHLTADGQVVIHHDDTLERLTGDLRSVSSLTWTQLRQVHTHSGATIPRLSDLIEAWPDTWINIEPKSDAVVEPLATEIRRMGVAHRIGVGSFEPKRIARLRTLLGPGLSWSPAHRGVLGIWLRGWGLPLPTGDFQMLQVPTRWRGIRVVTPRFVEAAHARGLQVHVWTVDDEPQMHRLLDMGVDALMTDRPTLLKSVLQARGQWRGRDA
jgi:glycerophosphoryl diester phosphodiesterase